MTTRLDPEAMPEMLQHFNNLIVVKPMYFLDIPRAVLKRRRTLNVQELLELR
jgi:hypothetical protein